jgi:very-short-patch-repair endonuclease
MPRKSIYTGTRYPKKTTQRPIKLVPNPERPIKLHRRDVLRRKVYQPDDWNLTIHRRGPRRLAVGMDPREARAVSHDQVAGTLPERIMWLWLTQHHVQFDFQSSLQGGRLEFGGIVADFILPDYMYVLNPAGPTHDTFLRQRKDEEQSMVLADFGYRVFFLDDDLVYNEYAFEERMRAILGLGPSGLTNGSSGWPETTFGDDLSQPDLDLLWAAATRLREAAFYFRQQLLADWATQ